MVKQKEEKKTDSSMIYQRKTKDERSKQKSCSLDKPWRAR
jgi:hypothetical protein